MSEIYSKDHPSPAVQEELKDVFTFERFKGIIEEAESITKRAVEPRWKKAARFMFEGLAYTAVMVDKIPPKMEKYDCTKEDEDEFNSF